MALIPLFSKLWGTTQAFFQFGNATGPGINANGTALETKNAANSAFAVHRGADPANDHDFVTLQFMAKALFDKPIAQQFNGGSALPANSATVQYYVVSTTGVNASIGQLLYDDGSGVGTVQVITAQVGATIVPESNFSGGTISFIQNNQYIWNGTTWVNITPQIAGTIYEIRTLIGTAASQSSATSIPANAVVSSVMLDTSSTGTTPYAAGALIAIGQTGTPALLQATADNVATIAGQYVSEASVPWGAAALPVLITITGAPATGAAYVVVQYSLPNG